MHMQIRPNALAVGLASYIPAFSRLTARRTGGTTSAQYCYAVWLRHLVHLRDNGLPTAFGRVIELGPGDSLGIGIAALLSGAQSCWSLDIVRYADPALNLRIFADLVRLFRERAPIPGPDAFPQVQPTLTDYAFPHDLLPPDRLALSLGGERLARIERALARPASDPRAGADLCYLVPWQAVPLPDACADLVLSQSVLQYAPDLPEAYATMRRWLRGGGAMSHEVDFKSIGRTRAWNGHWTCSDAVWTLAQGRRRNPINRQPLGAHLRAQEAAGFAVAGLARATLPNTLPPGSLARRFADLDARDLTTASALIQSRVRPG